MKDKSFKQFPTNAKERLVSEDDSKRAEEAPFLCEWSYLLETLRAFFSDREPPCPPNDFNEELFLKLANRQQVVAIVADELAKKPEYFSERLKKSLAKARASELVRDVAFYGSVSRIEAIFEKNKIRYLPLKGAITKGIYPQSYQRYSCDYDVLIEKHDIKRARTLLKNELGYEDAEKETTEQHYGLINPTRNLTTVELHYNLWGLYKTPVFKNPWERATQVVDARSKPTFKYRFTNEDFYYHVVAHLASHWLHDDITIRAFIDVWLYNKKFDGKFDRASLDVPLQKVGISEFVQNVERAGRVWFEGLDGDKTIEDMARRLFDPPERPRFATWGQGKNPFSDKRSRISEFFTFVLCLNLFQNRRLEWENLPFIKRVCWKFNLWKKVTLERMTRGRIFHKVCLFLFRREDRQEMKKIQEGFGFTNSTASVDGTKTANDSNYGKVKD